MNVDILKLQDECERLLEEIRENEKKILDLNYSFSFRFLTKIGSVLLKLKNKSYKKKTDVGCNELIPEAKTVHKVDYMCLPIEENKIVFNSFINTKYACNPKYITEYILKNIPKNTYKLVWIFDTLHNENIPFLQKRGIKCVKYESDEYYKEVATAKVWIANQRYNWKIEKRPDQFYIQTWHGSIGIKHTEEKVADRLDKWYLATAKKDSGICDLFLTGSKLDVDYYSKYYWYDGLFFENGLPRNDIFFHCDKEVLDNVYEKYKIPKKKKILFYCPTFRSDPKYDYNIDFDSILDMCTKKIGGDWVCIVRLHPNVSSKSVTEKENVLLINYGDCQEIMLVADILITDYSSTSFDFMLLNRPVFIYAPDYDDYLKKERELYNDIFSLPFSASTNIRDLCKNIEDFDFNEYLLECKEFNEKVGRTEKGNSCEMLMKYLEDMVFKK